MREKYDIDNPKMKESVVCYIDILGFEEMIKKAVKNNNANCLLKRLYNSIKDNVAFINPSPSSVGEIKIFTDNIVIGRPIFDDGESDLGNIFLNFARYQISLAIEGFFVRGGISVGEYYANEYISFGPALLEAHRIESKIADTPRIVLDQKVKKLVERHLKYYSKPKNAPQTKHILEDNDGEWFINYLAPLINECEPDFTYEILTKHRDMLINKINEFKSDSKIAKKYEWVAQYHNFFCNSNFSKITELQISSSKRFSSIV